MDEELTDSENEEKELQRDSSNQDGNEETRDPPLDGKSPSGKQNDSEPCCSSAVVDSSSSGNMESKSASSGPKVETEISNDDKKLPPCIQDNQSSQTHEVT